MFNAPEPIAVAKTPLARGTAPEAVKIPPTLRVVVTTPVAPATPWMPVLVSASTTLDLMPIRFPPNPTPQAPEATTRTPIFNGPEINEVALQMKVAPVASTVRGIVVSTDCVRDPSFAIVSLIAGVVVLLAVVVNVSCVP
jgi:hypothetical protein